MRSALAALLLCTALLGATPASTGIRVFVTLHVDAVDQGETVAVLRGTDVLVPVAAIEASGARGFGGTRSTLYGQSYVSLASLAPGITYTFDEEALTLEITVHAAYLPRSTFDLEAARPANLEYLASPGAYLNYAFGAGRGGDASGFAETAIRSGDGSFYTSITAASQTPLRRGLTYFEAEDRFRSLRRVVGDALVSTGDLGGSAFIGGFSSSRAFDLDPYAIHFPQPSISGAVTSPSTADVYVNGVLTNRIALPPGTFDLSRIPVTNGSATTSVVVTDAFGRTQTYQQGYYSNADLLLRGTSDFEYGAGLLRENAFGPGDRYRGLAALGRFRMGLSDRLSAGFRFEAKPHLLSLGPEADIGLRAGFLHLAAAFSDASGRPGAAYTLGYSYLAPRFGLGLTLTGASSAYANIGMDPETDRTLSSLSAFASAQVGKRSSLGLQLVRRIDRDSGASTRAALTDTLSIGPALSLSVVGEHTSGNGSGPGNALSVSLNVALGRGDLLVSERSQDGAVPETAVQIQQSPPGTYGLGFVAAVDHARSTVFNGTLQYRGVYGDYGFDYGHDVAGRAGYSGRAAGGIAFIGGGVYPTRPIVGSYALVELPGVRGVHVYLDNQDVGATDRRGRLLVPNLLPNYGNLLRLSDDDAPLDASIQTLERTIAPPVRGGAVVRFAVSRIKAIVGKIRIRLHGKTVVPAFGDLTLDERGTPAESALGSDGEFYLENVPVGTYPAAVAFREGRCDFSLNVRDETGVLADLGTLECTVP